MCLLELSNYKLFDNNLAGELVENRSFFKPVTIKEIVIFMIISRSGLILINLLETL